MQICRELTKKCSGTLHAKQEDSTQNGMCQSATMSPVEDRSVHTNFPETDFWPGRVRVKIAPDGTSQICSEFRPGTLIPGVLSGNHA
jgi:hypothetical protein